MSSGPKKNPLLDDGSDPILDIEIEDELEDASFLIPAENQETPSAIAPEILETKNEQELENQVNDIRSQSLANPLNSDQIDILKRYIELKETELRDLKHQQLQYQEHTHKAALKLDSSIKQNRLLTSQLDETHRNMARLNAEMEEERREHAEQITLLRNEYEEKLQQAGVHQDQLRELVRKKEEFKEKIREDLKRIKLKERELENKYELLKNDTQTLLDAKDKQILELKKKTDALDLELEQFDDKLRENEMVLNEVSVKKRRLIETMKLAISLLEDIDKDNSNPDSIPERKAG